jgi:YfiH family protein
MPLDRELVDEFEQWGVHAFTTTRAAGSFSTDSREPVREVTARWSALREELAPFGPRLATARQVHGTRVVTHGSEWEGWLRVDGADGHVAPSPGTALAVTIADCVPVFLAHPSGAVALLHSGWKGTAGRIVQVGIAELERLGLAARELRLHLGPSICGGCYEVSAEVYGKLTGRSVARNTCVNLRELIADHARAAGVREITTSSWCTRCDNDRFFSHRAGDEGRQLAVVIAER